MSGQLLEALLIQAWFARARPGQSPYRLYALSNLASLLALLSIEERDGEDEGHRLSLTHGRIRHGHQLHEYPTWPTTWFAPRTTGSGPFRDVYSVMNTWGANHCAVSYGHIGADLITLAAVLRIPVYMHNVAEEKVFRPSAWTAFGAMEPQGADLAYAPAICMLF